MLEQTTLWPDFFVSNDKRSWNKLTIELQFGTYRTNSIISRMDLVTFSKLFFALYFSTTLSTVLNSHQIHAAYNRANTVDIPDLLVGYIFSYSFGTIFQVFFLPGFVFSCKIWLICFCTLSVRVLTKIWH